MRKSSASVPGLGLHLWPITRTRTGLVTRDSEQLAGDKHTFTANGFGCMTYKASDGASQEFSLHQVPVQSVRVTSTSLSNAGAIVQASCLQQHRRGCASEHDARSQRCSIITQISRVVWLPLLHPGLLIAGRICAALGARTLIVPSAKRA